MKDAAILPPLDEPKAGALMVRYQPDEDTEVLENPPRFSWLPPMDENARYVLRIARQPDFADAALFPDIAVNFFTPDAVLEAGEHYWSYAVWRDGAPASQWSRARRFTVTGRLPETPLARRTERVGRRDLGRPRLWLGSGRLQAFAAAVEKNPEHCAWRDFHTHSVLPWPDRELVAEPPPYPGDRRVAELWRQIYMDCQSALYAIRNMAIAGRVLGDDALLDRAKAWLLHVAGWNPDGPTSRSYNDEAAFRVAVALAWGYDWLHDRLAEDERAFVRDRLLVRTRQVATHVMRHARIHLFPYDSHAVRALSAVLTPCCIALAGESDEAEDWLDYTVEYLFTLYTPWGGKDGGWAEGPHYWTTGMAYLLEAAELIRAFTGLDLLARPFFRRTAEFPFYTKAPDTRRSTFGDDSTLGALPSRKVGYNIRHLCGAAGDGRGQWYLDAVNRLNPGNEEASYNYGWWDFRFDEMVYRAAYPLLEPLPPAGLPRLKWFRDVGWAAIQSRLDDPERHLQFVFKASPFGTISHSHGDQNAFTLFAYGEDLAIQSGHYVAFGSTMHRLWRRQTRSKNAILIGGHGQYAGMDKAKAKRATGTILEAREEADHIVIRGDATAAYQAEVPHLKRYVREAWFVHDSYFVIVDRVELARPDTLQWLLHTNGPLTLGEDAFRYDGPKASLQGRFVLSATGSPRLFQERGFADVDPKEVEGLPEHWHLRAEFPAAELHVVVTLLVPHPQGRPKRIFHFIDDQGFTFNVYFTDEDDREFAVTVKKSYAAPAAARQD